MKNKKEKNLNIEDIYLRCQLQVLVHLPFQTEVRLFTNLASHNTVLQEWKCLPLKIKSKLTRIYFKDFKIKFKKISKILKIINSDFDSFRWASWIIRSRWVKAKQCDIVSLVRGKMLHGKCFPYKLQSTC